MTELQLGGIDGGNPLGFLAAVGTLATLTRVYPKGQARMGWAVHNGAWRPALRMSEALDEESLATDLCTELSSMATHPAFSPAGNLSIPVDDFAAWAAKAQAAATTHDRLFADFVAAFGCEAVQTMSAGKPTGRNADTAFRHVGAGQQRFFSCVRTLVEDTEVEHIRKTLFEAWRYDDPLETHSLRWDSSDDVRRALRWSDPSGDPERTRSGGMWGANRLALEALPLFPTAPQNRGLETTGFQLKRGSQPYWSWPIWEVFLSLDTIRSLLALAELTKQQPDRARLKRRGVAEVFRIHRVMQDKYRNFSTAHPA